MSSPSSLSEPVAQRFQPVRLVLVVFTVLLLISFASRWYAGQVSLPRYCQQSAQVLQRIEAIITEKKPAGDGARRDYIVAAKLEFLVPRTADESIDAYLLRLRDRLDEHCHQRHESSQI